MCKHLFEYLPDYPENYNPDGKTLTGVCKYCGVKQKAYGMRWMIPRYDNFLEQVPFGEVSLLEFVDKKDIIC